MAAEAASGERASAPPPVSASCSGAPGGIRTPADNKGSRSRDRHSPDLAASMAATRPVPALSELWLLCSAEATRLGDSRPTRLDLRPASNPRCGRLGVRDDVAAN